MLKSIAFDEEINLFWDLEEEFCHGCEYLIYLNGEKKASTDKSHYKIRDLKQNTEYIISLKLLKENGKILEVADAKIRTAKAKKRIDVTEAPYFASGDGRSLNTEKLQKALDDCKSDECVYIPSGDFKTGALTVHSNTEIYLENGAILHGTDEIVDYLPLIKSRFEGIERMCYSSLLNIGRIEGDRLPKTENVIIRGEGTVMCDGKSLSEKIIADEKNKVEGIDTEKYVFNIDDLQYGRIRPRLINISCSKNIVISGITLKDGASWNVHMIYSKDVFTFGCKFFSEGINNGDGWDPDSSENCTLFDCEFNTGDDSVAIKSGKNPEGNIIAKPCTNISIFDCVSHFGHGITIGSEMSGGVSNVRIWNCDMVKSAYGIEIKATKKRGGYVKNIVVKNCKVCHILLHSVGYNDDGEGAKCLPVFKNCTFSDIEIYKNTENYAYTWKTATIEIHGFDGDKGSADNIRLENINIFGMKEAKIDKKFCKNLVLKNINYR